LAQLKNFHWRLTVKFSSPFAESRIVTKKYGLLWFILCLMLLIGFDCAVAQEATIVGTVTDPSGAIVPNVSVTLINNDTGQSRSIKTNTSGEYVLPDLHIGHYTAKAEAQGFNVAERTGLVLNVGDRLRVDFAMKVGSAQEQVTVEAAAATVQTDTGEVSDLISAQEVTKLATNGRSIYSLVDLTPGASSLQSDFQVATPVGGDNAVSFNGQRPAHNIYLLDGGEDLDRGGSGNFSVMPSLESIAEFRVLSSNYSAEYGLSSSATMTTVLKSGTNKFHASAWEFFRNDALDARNYFNPQVNPNGTLNKVAKLRFNTYGFNVGGPLDFWKKDDHKTFFFYNMEWRSLIQGQTLNQAVPLPSEYGGNFGSTLVTVPDSTKVSPSVLFANCPGGTAPAGIVQGQPFPNNTIPSCMLSANAQVLLTQAKIFPAPTNGSQFLGGSDVPTNVREEIARIDHRFSDKFSIFGHWISEQISQGYGTTQWSSDNVPTIGDTFGNPSYSAVVHATHTISPNLLNEIAFNYNGNRIHITPLAASGAMLSAPSSFAFNRIFTGPNVSNRMPSINLTQLGTNYTANWTPWNNAADDYQIRDDISWVKGKHQLRLGASWALYKKAQDVFASTQGNFSFNGFFSGNDFADFLLGLANSYSEDAVHDTGHWNNVSYAAYVQDNWRTTNRLTLNLGLRWDGAPHTYETNHRMANFYPNLYNPALAAAFDSSGNICSSASDPGCTAASPGLGSSPNPILSGYQFYLNGVGIDGVNGVPKGLVNNHWAAFGPRFGFAYDLTGRGKTVIRGGFGVMYERIQGNDMYNGGTNVPFSANASFSNVSLSDPHTSVTTGAAQIVPIVVPSITGIALNNYKLPVSYQYSAGVQQSLGAKSVLSVAYVGDQNRHQNDYREINLPPVSALPGLIRSGGAGYNQLLPYLGFRSLKMAENEANAHYNSLQVNLHTVVRNDLQAQVGYTLSRAIDPVTGANDLQNVSNPYEGWKYDVGPSIFDHTHVAFADFVYQIPLLKNSSNHLLRTTLGGWELAGIVNIMSGAPINVVLGGPQGSNGVQNATNRPDLVGAISYPKKRVANLQQFGIQWFDPSAFAAPAVGAWGSLGFDALRGPGRDNWNLALHKTFAFTEHTGLEFRVESFNTWNHTQFKADVRNGGIGNTFSGSNFGLITSAYDPRVLQLSAKVFF
jgi:hypothetical protein